MNMGQAVVSVTLLAAFVILAVMWIAADSLTGGIAAKSCPDATLGVYLRCLESIYGPERTTP